MSEPNSLILQPHALKIVLVHPQIAPNTGNIARAAVAAGAQLHLVRPLGFILSDRTLRRSAMDYWPRLQLTIHDDLPTFLAEMMRSGDPFWFFSSKATRSLWQATFTRNDWLIFGSETAGLSEDLLAEHQDRALRIPQAAGERCLNLSTAAGIGLYEALRQLTG